MKQYLMSIFLLGVLYIDFIDNPKDPKKSTISVYLTNGKRYDKVVDRTNLNDPSIDIWIEQIKKDNH